MSRIPISPFVENIFDRVYSATFRLRLSPAHENSPDREKINQVIQEAFNGVDKEFPWRSILRKGFFRYAADSLVGSSEIDIRFNEDGCTLTAQNTDIHINGLVAVANAICTAHEVLQTNLDELSELGVDIASMPSARRASERIQCIEIIDFNGAGNVVDFAKFNGLGFVERRGLEHCFLGCPELLQLNELNDEQTLVISGLPVSLFRQAELAGDLFEEAESNLFFLPAHLKSLASDNLAEVFVQEVSGSCLVEINYYGSARAGIVELLSYLTTLPEVTNRMELQVELG